MENNSPKCEQQGKELSKEQKFVDKKEEIIKKDKDEIKKQEEETYQVIKESNTKKNIKKEDEKKREKEDPNMMNISLSSDNPKENNINEEKEEDDSDDEKDEEMEEAETEESRIQVLQNEIQKFKETLTEKQTKENNKLMKMLTRSEKNFKFEYNSIKCLINYKFGDIIDNNEFIRYMKNGLSTLYSYDKNIKKSVFKFFKRIKKKIKDFIYIPMISDSPLNELKKQIYLGAISNQIEEIKKDDNLIKYIFYTESYFKEEPFDEISIDFERDKEFIKLFDEYNKTHKFQLNLDSIKDFIFSPTIKEAYLESCIEVFGKEANFVNIANIENALNDIYKYIVKNIKVANLPKLYYGITTYSKKIFISSSFKNNIKKSKDYKEKLTYLAGLIITILQEIMHCLTNYLPLYSNEYKALSNPFIRSFKKNLKIFDYVLGNKIFKEEDKLLYMIEDEIGSKLIIDPGYIFEKKLFKKKGKINYMIAEYFLKNDNLKKSLENFSLDFKTFKNKFKCNLYLKRINKETSITFRRAGGSVYGGCFFRPHENKFME